MPDEQLAKYACDECRSRKIRCSREAAGCMQCHTDSRNCVYSRSGVIRRKARQSKKQQSSNEPNGNHESPAQREPHTPAAGDLRPQLVEDIDIVQDSLNQFNDSENDASGTLASLGAEYSSFWQGPSLKEMANELGVEEKRFLPFPDEQDALFTVKSVEVSRKGRPILTPIPLELLREIRRSPETVHEKAYLVIVYGILLTDACLDESNTYSRATITKLRWNLRLALDDAKLLLEPSDLNIQALILLACHVQEVSTPSFCWMIISTACRMLQVLGISNTRSLDCETRERRVMLFWMLNGLDKSLALISGRSPTFHKAMYGNGKVPMIGLQKMLEYQPHVTAEGEGFKSMFGAHIMRQMYSLSSLLADIWACLFEDGAKSDTVRRELDEWWKNSTSILEACLLAERPFLSSEAQRSMELGIKNQEFHYHYLSVLLIRSKLSLREEAIYASQQALFLLDDLVSDSNEVYNGIIWLLLYCPFTPFFVLFGDVLSKKTVKGNERSLEAMEKLEIFLARMRPRHPRAAKLHTIAAALVRYARTALTKADSKASKASGSVKKRRLADESRVHGLITLASDHLDTSNVQASEQSTPASASTAQQPIPNVFDDPSLQALSMDLDFWLPSNHPWEMEGFDGGETLLNGIGDDPYGFFTDSTFDWFSWDANLSNPLGL